jgi:hypothetical protein
VRFYRHGSLSNIFAILPRRLQRIFLFKDIDLVYSTAPWLVQGGAYDNCDAFEQGRSLVLPIGGPKSKPKSVTQFLHTGGGFGLP